MYREKIKEALEAKRAEAQKLWGEFDEARKTLTADGFDPTKDKDAFDKAQAVHRAYAAVDQEVKELATQYESAIEMDGSRGPGGTPFDDDGGHGKNGDGPDGLKGLDGEAYTPGDKFIGSPELKAIRQSGVLDMEKGRVNMAQPVKVLTRAELKTLLTGGGAPGTQLLVNERLPGIMPLLRAPLKMTNLITVGSTDANVIEWVRQSAIANNAAEVAEATATTGTSGTKPESGMTFIVESTTVRTIAHWIPATKQALSDMPQLRTLVDSMLIDGIARRLNTQILNGDGVAPNLKGILNQAGLGAMTYTVSVLETLLRAITQVRLAFFEPTAVLMNPLDYITIRLLRDDSGAGVGTGGYLFGPPSQVGIDTVWGIPIVQDVTLAQGSAVVADWKQAILYVREGVNVIATDSHSDFFVRNLVAILAEGRYAVAVPRPQAFSVADLTP